MGCHNSKNNNKSDSPTPPANISKKSRKIVQAMWIELKPDSKNFGISLFLRLFDESPDIQELFYSFKDLKNQDELVQSLEELDHVARVMNSFGNCIELLSDKSQFTDMVQRLGTVHKKIGIKPEHLNVFGNILLESIAKYCQATWTIEKEKAWSEAFDLLAENFAIGLRGEKCLTCQTSS